MKIIDSQYKIIESLGVGGMGEVFKAIDIRDNSVRALKILNQEMTSQVQQFKEEFKILTQLRHPYLVRVHNFGLSAEGTPYYSMDYMPGGDIGSKSAIKTMDDFYRYALMLLSALDYIHSRNIIHGDIKPSNILFDQLGNPRLVDFGLALHLRSDTVRSSGTLEFAPPEIIKHGQFSPQSDLYSLGLVFYESLLEKPFFRGATSQILTLKFQEKVELPEFPESKGGGELRSVIDRMLQNDPQNRYHSAGEVAGSLESIAYSAESTTVIKDGKIEEAVFRDTSRDYFERASFCGRNREFDVLKAAFGSIADGYSPVVYITGESGVGKSRLVEQFKYNVQMEGCHFVQANCVESDNTPLLAVSRLIEQLILLFDPDYRTFEAMGKEIRRLFPLKYPDIHAEQDLKRGKQRLHFNLQRYVKKISFDKKVILLIEDLQWADSQTIDFLNYLSQASISSRLAGGNGFLLILTSQVVPDKPGWDLLKPAKTITLEPADQPLWAEFLQNLFGDYMPPQAFTDNLFKETGGNFLFAEELLKSLADGRIIFRSGGYWKLESQKLTGFPLPKSVAEAITRRLSRLDISLRAIVEQAAVMDNIFSADELLELSGFSGNDKNLLDKLVLLRVFQRQNGSFQFLHNQVRSVAYNLLPDLKKKQLHRQAAFHFESRNARPEYLAEQFLSAEIPDKAFHYLSQAAENAAGIFGWRQAANYYEKILTLLAGWAKAPRSAKYEILLRQAKSLMFIDPKSADKVFSAALVEADKTEDRLRNVNTVLINRAENCQHLGANEEALKLYGEVIANWGKNDSGEALSSLLGEAYMGMGWVKNKLGKLDDAGKDYFKALDYFVENPERMCRVLSYLGIVYTRQGDLDGALDYYNRSLRVCEDNDYKIAAMQLYGNIGNVHNARSNHKLALEYYEKSLKIALEISDRRIEGVNLLNIGHSHNQIGNQPKALEYFQQALQIQQEIGDRSSEAVNYSNLAEMYQNQGSFKEAYNYVMKGIELAREIKEPRIELAGLKRLADIYREIGDLNNAYDYINQALEQASKLGDDQQKNWVLAIKAEIQLERGALIDAEKCLFDALFTNPEDVSLRARLLMIKARVKLASGHIQSAEQQINLLSTIDLPLSFKSSLCYLKALVLLKKYRDRYDLRKAEEEILAALDLAGRYGPAGEKPKYLATLAGIKRKLNEKYDTYITKAKSLASGFCVGWSSRIQKSYLERFELAGEEKSGMPSRAEAEEETMIKSNREKSLETLFEVAKTVNTIHELDPLLNRIMDLMLINLKAERGFIMLKDTDDNLEPMVARNIDKKNIFSEDTISHSSMQDVYNSGQPLLLNRTPGDETDRKSVIDFQITSIMCAPLKSADKVVGIVYVDTRASNQVFNNDDLDFLLSFCNLAAIAIDNARLTGRLVDRNVYLQKQLERSSSFQNIIGRSSPMQRVFRMAESVAATDATVVLTGESGTGKEILARAIHYSGPRKKNRFIPIDCGSLPESLLESELFGHKKGSFTGAISDRVGLFEEADGGTVFLDEITNTTQNFQVKLLRVIQEGEFRRVGDVKSRSVDVRIIAATNKELKDEVAEGSFREDLYYRLNVVNIPLPALRERREDIPLLAEYFLEIICRKMKLPKKSITSKAIDYLINYHWPGNVRQLENIVERMVIFSKGEFIDVPDLPQEIKTMFSNIPAENKTQLSVPHTKVELKSAKAQLDRLFIMGIMEQAGGNVMKAAKISGMDRTQLHHMLNKYSLNSGHFKKNE